MKKVLLYLDTNKVVNPFDLLLALDSGYDAVLPYGGINEENVEYIIHNTIFARNREGLDNTVIMVGGILEESEKVFSKLRRLLRPPFNMSVVLDPNGACTTAAAAVAKIEKLAENLRGKKVTILAGTGPIGQISAILLRNLGAEVTITSRSKEKATKIANRISDDVRGKVKGENGGTPADRCEACKSADIILATGAVGAQLLDSEGLEKMSAEVVADVNAIQPYGVEDMKPDYEGDIVSGSKMLGSCAIGDLKNLVETKMLKAALEEIKFYDYNDSLSLARELAK